MKEEILIKIFSKILRRFRKKYKLVFNNPDDEEAIHDLRTNIKRIKAFLKFVNKVDNQFEFNKLYEPWKNLFKEVGRYRDKQVLLNKAFEKSETAIGLKLQCDLLDIKPLKKYFGKGFLQTVISKIKHSLKNDDLNSDIKAYLENRINNISALLNLKESKRELKLHVLRKLLKELNYNLKVLRKLPEMKYKGKQIDPWVDKMTDLLGAWHDNKMSLSVLDGPSKSLPMNLIGIAKKNLKKELIAENVTLKYKINTLCLEKDNLEHLLRLSQNF